MTLAAGCPRCPVPLTGNEESWSCPDHGAVAPLWRSDKAGYDDLAPHLQRSGAIPSLLPWPLPPGWMITDFGCVGTGTGDATAVFVSCAGPSEPDGVVEVTVVSEEPGIGLGARCAGVDRTDPGADIGEGPPPVRIKIRGHPVALWPVSTSVSDPMSDRSVLAGEAMGRWLWLVLRPASAALLLTEDWLLHDLAELGPALVDLPFGGTPPAW